MGGGLARHFPYPLGIWQPWVLVRKVPSFMEQDLGVIVQGTRRNPAVCVGLSSKSLCDPLIGGGGGGRQLPLYCQCSEGSET